MITVFCTSCNKETESAYHFCKHCGSKLPDTAITTWLAIFAFLVAFGGLAWLAVTL